MIKSMTGFGKAVCECQNRKMVVEIKSLNSKLLDINARIPNGYREKEVEIRNLISNRLHRGKVDFQITIENSGDTSNYSINKSLAQKYYRELKELSLDLDEKDFSDYLLIIMRMPDVLVTEINEISEEEWSELKKAILQAIDEVDMFRINEGKGLGLRFLRHIERNSLLLFMVPCDTNDIADEYRILLRELQLYNPEMLDKQRILAVTKSDMIDEELKEEIEKELPDDVPYVFISSIAQQGLAELKDLIWDKLNE